MSQYQVVKKDGSFLTMIQDSSINTTATSLVLFGHDFVDYGNYLNENLVYLTENFANVVAPLNQLVGQLWYNSELAVLSYYDISNQWMTIVNTTGATFTGNVVVSNGTDMVELLTNGNITLSNPNGSTINFQNQINGPSIAQLYINNTNNVTTLHSSVSFVSDQSLTATQNLYVGNTLVIDNVANLYCQNNQLYSSSSFVSNGNITTTNQYNFSSSNSNITSGSNLNNSNQAFIDFSINGNQSYVFSQNGQLSINSPSDNPVSISMANANSTVSINQYAPVSNSDAVNIVASEGLYVNGTLTASVPYVNSQISSITNTVSNGYLPLTGGVLNGNLTVTNTLNFKNSTSNQVNSSIYTDNNGTNGGNDICIQTGPNTENFIFDAKGGLTLPQQASTDLQAPQWGQVKTLISSEASSLQNEINNLANNTSGNYLPLSGGTLTGALLVNSSIQAQGITVEAADNSGSAYVYSDVSSTGDSNSLCVRTGTSSAFQYFVFSPQGFLELPVEATSNNQAPQWGQVQQWVQQWSQSNFIPTRSPRLSSYLTVTTTNQTITVPDNIYMLYVRLWGAGGGGGGGGSSAHGAWGGAGGGGGGCGEIYLNVTPGQQISITIGSGGGGGGYGNSGGNGGSSSFGNYLTCGGGSGGGAGGSNTTAGVGGNVWVSSGVGGFGLVTNASGSMGTGSYHDSATGAKGGGTNGGVGGSGTSNGGNAGFGGGGGGAGANDDGNNYGGGAGGSGLCAVIC